MEAYLNLNWRTSDFSLLTSDEFIPASSVKSSYVFKGLDNLPKVDLIAVNKDYIPGLKYYKQVKQRSVLHKEQQQECLHALLLMMNCKEKLNTYDQSTLEVYKRLRQRISEENIKYSKYVRDEWNKWNHTYMIPKALTKHAMDSWKLNLQCVQQYPDKYKLFETISCSYDPGDSNAEMILKQNIFDLGHVAKYIRPIFLDEHLLKDVIFPITVDNNLYFKNKVSEDRNIDQMVDKNPIDVVMSSGGFKKLMEIHDVSSNWDIPIVVRPHNGKNVCFIDEPLRCSKPNKLCVNQKSYKDAIKLKFCGYKGFSYDSVGYTIKAEEVQSTENEKDQKIYENVAYKIWTLKKSNERNELLKAQKFFKELNVLVRSKIDACELLSDGKLQPVTIVPKLEYQLSFGGSVCSKSDLIKQWCSLFIRPQSILHRVRIHPDTSEVIMVDTCNLQKINHEAQSLYNLIPSNGLQVLYNLFSTLSTLKCGHYLLHHKLADGGFVSLLEETNISAGNVYNLHENYSTVKVIIEIPKIHPWLAIDCNLILPAHKKLNIMPGMFAGASNSKSKGPLNQKAKARVKGKRQGPTINRPNNKNNKKMRFMTRNRPNTQSNSNS